MDDTLIASILDARNRRLTGPAADDTVLLRLYDDRNFLLRFDDPMEEETCLAIGGHHAEGSFHVFVPLDSMPEMAFGPERPELMLLSLVDAVRDDIEELEMISGGTITLDTVATAIYRPAETDIRVVPFGIDGLVLRLSPDLKAGLKEIIAPMVVEKDIVLDGEVRCMIVAGVLAGLTGAPRAGEVLMLDRPLCAPFAIIEDAVVVGLTQGEAQGGLEVWSLAALPDFLHERGIGLDDVLLISDRASLAASALPGLALDTSWPFAASDGRMALCRSGRTLAHAHLIGTAEEPCLDILPRETGENANR